MVPGTVPSRLKKDTPRGLFTFAKKKPANEQPTSRYSTSAAVAVAVAVAVAFPSTCRPSDGG